MGATWREEWRGKRVAVIGLGVSNLALIQFLKQAGAQLSGRDVKSAAQLGERLEEIEALEIELILGQGYLRNLLDFDCVVVSPGVPKHLPELEEVKRLGRLESEIGLVIRYSRAPIYGITGSNGKTTTTSLVSEMLRQSGISTYVGGNIGNPLILELENINEKDNVLLELSSFQLEGLTRSPRGALVTNITQNHLDIHGTMENYIRAKQNIFLHQKTKDFLILNYDDPTVRAMAKNALGRVFFFSLAAKIQNGAYLDGDDLVYAADGEKVVFAKSSQLALPGEHNVANFLAAALFGHLLGASWQVVGDVGRSFTGVSHRLEYVEKLSGVHYYNDSIATTPERTLAALHSFDAPIILIAGGSDKELSYTELAQAIHRRVKHLVLLGETATKIRNAVLELGDFPLEMVGDLTGAMNRASQVAKDGDVVLLSPASASYDQYSNFMERGAHFRKLVQTRKREQKETGGD